jgi:glycosyltransferase involved in cell wall biosynthesis
MKVILTRPPLPAISGVSAYYRAVEHHVTAAGVEIRPVEIGSLTGRSFHTIRDQLAFLSALKEDDTDLIHVNPSLKKRSFLRDGLFMRAARRRKLPVLVHFHGWGRRLEDRLSDGSILWFFRRTYGKADAYVVLAEEFKRRLRAWGVDGPVHVDTTAVDDDLLSGFDIRKRSGGSVEAGAVNMLFLARIETGKGIFETIEACALLRSRGLNVSLTVAGDGSELERAKGVAERRLGGSARFLGFVSGREKARVFEGSDIYVLPTYTEGMPASVLEAMSFGLPVVTRPVGGLRDFFVDGEHGYLTESKAPSDIASLVQRIVSDADLWRRMSIATHEYAVGRFLGSMVAGRLVDIYEAILKTRDASA